MNRLSPCRLIVIAAGVVLAAAPAGFAQREEPRRDREPQPKAADSALDAGKADANAVPPGDNPDVVCDSPKGWLRGNPSGMRKVAFVVLDGDRKVEVTAVHLPIQSGALLPNVNRWRRQIKLPDITQAELDKSVGPIQVGAVEGRYLELLGPAGAEPRQAILAVVAMRGKQAWFFKLWGNAELALREKSRFQEFVKSVRFVAPSRDGLPSALTEDGGDSPLKYDTPVGWKPSEAQGAHKAAFDVANGGQNVEVGVVQLPGRIEALLPNVNRWRRQVRLGEISQAELEKSLRRIRVGDADGDYLELVGREGAKPRRAMLVVVAVHDGKSWLFRMTGDADLVLREKDRFEAFVKSVRFSSADRSQHGD